MVTVCSGISHVLTALIQVESGYSAGAWTCLPEVRSAESLAGTHYCKPLREREAVLLKPPVHWLAWFTTGLLGTGLAVSGVELTLGMWHAGLGHDTAVGLLNS